VPLAFLVVVFAVYFFTRPRPVVALPEPALSRQTPEQEEPALAAPARVEVDLVSSPVSAEAWLDSENAPRGSTPLRMLLPRSDTPVPAVLKATGYQDKKVLIDASKSGTVIFRLDPERAASPAKPRERVAPPGRAREKKPAREDEDSSATFKAVGD
jgi:hypothetical protein